MVGEATAHGLPATLASREVVLARELPCRLDRLGAAGDEEDAVEVARREGRDLGRELDRPRMRVRPVGVEGQLAHLLVCRLADLVAVGVADLHREEPGQRVEIALAVRVLEVAAVAADDDRRLAAAHPGEVQPEVVAGRTLELLERAAGLGQAHAYPCGWSGE